MGSKNSKIRLGCIGVGVIAEAVHLPQVAVCDDFELTAVCDIDPQRLSFIGEKYGIPPSRRFLDYRELIACKAVDAVDICTPNDSHCVIAMEAVRAGKPYAVEKPAGMNFDEVDRLAKATSEAALPGMVCFSYRFKPAARYAQSLVSQGLLGEIYHVNMEYSQSWGLPDMNTPLVWRFVREQSGSGALGDLGSHSLDLVQFITGKDYIKFVSQADTFVKMRPLVGRPEKVGTADVDDYCNYLAGMEGGTAASFQITRFGFGRGNYQRMEVYGSKGSLVYRLDQQPDEDELFVCIGEPAGESHVYTKIPVPERFWRTQMQSYADLIHGCADNTVPTIADGQKNQRALDAVICSFEKERWIYMDELTNEKE